MAEHGFMDETYTVWCLCGAGFDSVDEFDVHMNKHLQENTEDP